jgi:hypothetical protein
VGDEVAAEPEVVRWAVPPSRRTSARQRLSWRVAVLAPLAFVLGVWADWQAGVLFGVLSAVVFGIEEFGFRRQLVETDLVLSEPPIMYLRTSRRAWRVPARQVESVLWRRTDYLSVAGAANGVVTIQFRSGRRVRGPRLPDDGLEDFLAALRRAHPRVAMHKTYAASFRRDPI